MSTVVNILFENSQKLFFPGQIISGIVEITTTKDKHVKKIDVKLKGIAKVRWREYDSKNKKWITRRRIERYYSTSFNILNTGNQPQFLPIGVHHFPFRVILPAGVPCSFRSKYGNIFHSCSASVDIENKFFDVKCTVPFSVGSLYDLNYDPLAKTPIRLNEDKTICCLCCAGGELAFTLNIGYSGYVPGQSIVINAECSNRSNRNTTETRAELHQDITFKAEGHRKHIRTKVSFKCHGPTEPGNDDIWSGECLAIPPLPPSGMPGCNIIDIEYTLTFSFCPSGMAMNLSKSCLIVIGAIPLQQTFATFQTRPYVQPAPQPSFPPIAANASAPPVPYHQPAMPSAPSYAIPKAYSDNPPPYPWAEQYPDLPPPSYESCTLANEETGDSDASSSQDDDSSDEGASDKANRPRPPPYTPLYVTYGWAPPQN